MLSSAPPLLSAVGIRPAESGAADRLAASPRHRGHWHHDAGAAADSVQFPASPFTWLMGGCGRPPSEGAAATGLQGDAAGGADAAGHSPWGLPRAVASVTVQPLGRGAIAIASPHAATVDLLSVHRRPQGPRAPHSLSFSSAGCGAPPPRLPVPLLSASSLPLKLSPAPLPAHSHSHSHSWSSSSTSDASRTPNSASTSAPGTAAATSSSEAAHSPSSPSSLFRSPARPLGSGPHPAVVLPRAPGLAGGALWLLGFYSRESEQIRAARTLYRQLEGRADDDQFMAGGAQGGSMDPTSIAPPSLPHLQPLSLSPCAALQLPPSFRVRHSLLVLHLWLCLSRLRSEGQQGAVLGQMLYDLFSHDREKRVVREGVRRGKGRIEDGAREGFRV